MANNYFGVTDTGMVRTNNEDSFIAEPLKESSLIAACVIDGVGGYEGGEIAAQLAHDSILNQLAQSFSINHIDIIKAAFDAANQAICEEKISGKKNEQMACVATLALSDVKNNKFYYGHVGDTRLYLLRDRSLVKISRDHSFVGFLEDSGKLNEQEAMTHVKRNEINKALGFDKGILIGDYIETGESPFLPGDIILLCSDGLTDMVNNHAMTSILTTEKDIEAKAKALVNAANNAGGKDNITVVLVENNKAAIKHTASKPVTTNTSMETGDTKNERQFAHKDENTLHGDKQKRSGTAKLFGFLFMLIIIVLGWLVYKYYYNRNQHKNETPDVAIRVRNIQEQVFLDSIAHNATGEVFVLNQAGNAPLIITDSIKVSNDTLHIIGNGVTLVADSFYKGPAFVLAEKCKNIVLDSLTLQNFDVGVIANSKALVLRKVQFKNCRVPVQYQFLFKENEVINERIGDTGLSIK